MFSSVASRLRYRFDNLVIRHGVTPVILIVLTIMLLLALVAGIYLGWLWLQDRAHAVSGQPRAQALPGATSAPFRLLFIAIAGSAHRSRRLDTFGTLFRAGFRGRLEALPGYPDHSPVSSRVDHPRWKWPMARNNNLQQLGQLQLPVLQALNHLKVTNPGKFG